MKKIYRIAPTILYYSTLLCVLIIRVNSYCEGNLVLCGQKRIENDGTKITDATVFVNLRETFTLSARKFLPSPHSELLLGMTIGLDYLNQVPKFKQMLKDTGTIHVVVVSGFNISLVFNFLSKIVGTKYKIGNLIICLLGTFLYSLLSGFEPPVVRAWLMGIIISFGSYYGRRIDIISVLFSTALVLCAVNPFYLFSMSFHLSFAATLSLVMFSESIKSVIVSKLKIQNVFVDDLSATLSAQILVWPIISKNFGTVSLISPVVNALILWTVPLITTLGFVFLVLISVFEPVGKFMALIIYMPLEIFTIGVEEFARFSFSTTNFNIGSIGFAVYYILIFVVFLALKRKSNSK